MASIYQRKNKDGTKVWRAVIRIKGYPTVCYHDERKQVVQDWARETEQQIRAGKYKFDRPEQTKTVTNLIDRYLEESVCDHHKSEKDTRRHLQYFKESIGQYALAYITPDLLIAEQKKLLKTPTYRGASRNAATVNRYFSSLSGALRYALRNLRWIDENPCLNLLKLKETPKKRRVLSSDEEMRLLQACKESLSPYLYCITLIAMTTGARKGEILALTWDCIDFEQRLAHCNGREKLDRKIREIS